MKTDRALPPAIHATIPIMDNMMIEVGRHVTRLLTKPFANGRIATDRAFFTGTLDDLSVIVDRLEREESINDIDEDYCGGW